MQTWVDGRSRFGERVEDQGRPAGPIHQAPRPAAPAPCPGSCHLLGRKDGKSKGSSLCRHLETRLPKHSGGGAVGEGPGEGHQAHEWRRSEHVPTRTVPGGQGPGCPETPGTGGPAWGSSREGAPALAGSVCASVLVLSVRGRRAFSASRGGRRWRDLPSVCGGAPACGLGCAHSHGGGEEGRVGGQLSRHSAALSRLAQHQWVTTACRGPREGEGPPQPQQQQQPSQRPRAHQPALPRFRPLRDPGPPGSPALLQQPRSPRYAARAPGNTGSRVRSRRLPRRSRGAGASPAAAARPGGSRVLSYRCSLSLSEWSILTSSRA